MLTVSFITLADASGSFTSARPAGVDKWLLGFKSPNGFKIMVKDDDQNIVGTKEFSEESIKWIEAPAKVSSKKDVLGCKSTIASLDMLTIQKAKELGAGNMSLGLRLAVSIAYAESEAPSTGNE